MPTYSLVPLIGLLMVIVTSFDVLFNKNYQARNKNALIFYRLFLYTLMGFLFCDLLWGIFDEFTDNTPVYVTTFFFFFFMFSAAMFKD